MRIVKLSDLSEEDKKRIQERQIQNLQTNKQNRIEANKKFNELIDKKGEFDTSKHTSTVGRLQKAYKNNEIAQKSLDDYYKNNTTYLWKETQNFADATGKIGENIYKGAENGIFSSIQNLGRNMFNLQGRKEEENIFDKVNKQILDSRKDINSEEKTNIINKMNNSSFSQKNLIKGIEEKNQKFQEKKNENTFKIQQNTDSISNPVGKYLAGEIAPGIGQMLPGMLPIIGTTYFISSATGNYYDDAIQRGMTENQATLYAGTMGIIEGTLESLGAKLTKNVGKQLLKKNIKGALVNYGLDIGENFLEESIVEPISEIAAQVYGGKDKADWSNVWQRAIESGVAGALTSAITGGVSGIIGGVGSKVTQQNQYVDYNTNKKLNKDSQNWLKQAENIIQENSTPKLSPQLPQNQQNTTTQQITPTIQNNAQNGISEQTNSMLNNKDVPMLNYQYEKSDNVKINNLRQDANRYFNNSEKAKNYVSMLERIITDKNIDIRLDANLKTPDGKIANGSYSNGVITINPNSTRAGEFIAVHELTHAIGTDSMRNIIETYRKSNPEFNTAVEKLLQNYNSSEITEEALSDVSAQLFGNQEFINNVAQTNPNIFKKIYSEIKYLWHQFRGYKNQDQFVEDLYYKWTQAYNSSNKLNETSNYYIEPIANFNETEYNNIIEEKLTKKEYAILRSIINSDSNIKPGINYIEVTNGRYTVYYKGFDDFKVMSRKVDTDAGRINKRNDTTGRKARYSKTFEQSFGNERTTTSNDEISNINTQGTRERSGSDTSSSTNIENVKYSIQESENNSGSFNLQKNTFDVSGNENLANAQTLFYRTREDGLYYVQATDGSGKIIYDGVFYGEKQLARSLGEEIANKIVNTSENTNNEIYLQSDNIKNETDYMMAHRPTETGAYASNITKGTGEWESLMPEDVYEHPEWYFDMNQEYSKESFKVLKQIKNNPNAEITIYRATTGNKINVGDWVTLSKKYAEYHNNSQFNGKGNIIELKVKAKDVQYAGDDINEFGYYPSENTKYSQNNGTWQSYLNNNFKSTGTRTNLQDIKNIAPIAKGVKNNAPIKNTSNMQEYDIDEGILKELPATGLQLSKGISSFDESSSFINNSIPQNKNSVKDNTITNNYMQNAENNSDSLKAPVNTSNMQVQQEKVKAPISGDVKARKHYKSIMESQYTSNEAKAISKELMGTDTYVPDSNNSQLERANERILNSTPESELNSFMSKVMNGEKITATDIAVGEKLIQYYSKAGDKGKLQDAIQATAMAGTSAGQTVQALSLLNHQTPEGQAIWLQRSVDKMNNDLKKTRGANAEQFNLTEDMINKIVDSKNNEELQNNLNDVYKELGQQVSKTNLQKIDAWRYFAMLANPKTHIRNIVGNTAMAGVQSVKNKVAGSIEGIVSKVNPNMERNHTIASASKDVITFAQNDIKNVADRLGLNENKYNPKNRLENSMRTFKSEALENTIGKLFDLNDKLLEAEDGWGLKAGYTKALSEYMTANKLNPDTITDKQLAKARKYAVEQAQEATFHQASAIATALNQFQNKNGLTKFIMESTLPFKKTPINVAKAGLEYSPVGLAKSLIYDTVKLRKGDITVNKYIDNISKGLTGTGIALLGYALADAGILKASGSDDKDKENYDKEMGKQTYSITIAGNTYSLDWLAPTGIPLFIGAECHELMQTDKEEKTTSSDENSKYNQALKSATNVLDSFTNAMNPMTEMSMLSGLTSALKSYDQGSSQMIASLGTNAVKSYVNQFVPTALGQIARTTDEYERNTTSTKTGVLPKAIDTTKNQIMNKIPGLRQMLPIRTDIWGNQVKQTDNIIQRGLENSVFPWTRKEVSTSKVDNELTELYNETGESSVLPDILNKKLTINGQDYRLTNEEYNEYKTSYGKTSYKLLNDLVSSGEYNNMSSSQKQIAIKSIYDYAKEKNKVDYANKVKENIDTSTNYNILEELNKSGGNQTQYLNYLSKTKEIQGEKANQKKNQVLLDANYSPTTKSIIYQNTTGKDDKIYSILINGKIDINEYLDYKIRDSKEEFKADKDKNDKTISGSSKKKKYDYVNQNIKGVNNRLLILANEYKLTDNERKKLTEYINTTFSSKSEKIEIFKQLSNNYIVKDGKVYYK